MLLRALLLLSLAAVSLASAFDGVIDPAAVTISERVRYAATAPTGYNENAAQFAVSPDGSYYTLWRQVHRYFPQNPSVATDQAVLRKFNSDGTLAWERKRTINVTYITPTEPNGQSVFYNENWGGSDPGRDVDSEDGTSFPNIGRLIAMPDGGVVVAFDMALLRNAQFSPYVDVLHRTLFVKFDAAGKFVWRNIVGQNGGYPAYVKDFQVGADGGVVALCYTAAPYYPGPTTLTINHQILVRKVSGATGELVFDGEYGGDRNFPVTDSEPLALGIDGQSRIYVLASQVGDRFEPYDASKSQFEVRRISPDGSGLEHVELPIFGDTFALSLGSMAVDAAGNTYLAGSYLATGGSSDVGDRGTVIKIDTSLVKQWQAMGPLPQRFFNDRPGAGINRICVTPQGITTAGSTHSGGIRADETKEFGETMRFDFDGNLIWHRYLESQVTSTNSGAQVTVNDLEVDASGDVFERGSQTVDVSTGSVGSFVSKYSSTGVLQLVKIFPNDLSAKLLRLAPNGKPTLLAQPFTLVDTDTIVDLNNPADQPAPVFAVQVTGITEGQNFKNSFGETIDFGARTEPASVPGVNLTRVEYYIDGTFFRGSGTAPFTTELFAEDLTVGAHSIFVRAFARGFDPIESEVVHFTVGVSPGSNTTLTVQISGPAGSGKITNGFLGATTRKTGDQVAITAAPNPGFIFTGWTGSITTNSATVSFTVAPGMLLTANFAPSPFLNSAGTYSGVAEIVAGTGLGTASFVTTLNTSGRFSGKLTIGKLVIPITGAFQPDGTYQRTFKVGSRPVELSLHLEAAGGITTVNGTVDVAGNSFIVSATPKVFNREHPAPQAGRYTFVLPAVQTSGTPAGDAWFTANVNANGNVTVTGTLPDGTKISRTSTLTADGSVPLYVPLYSARGALGGEVSFVYPRPADLTASDVTGTLHWQKPTAGVQVAFSADGQVVGSFYTAPDSAHTVFATAPGNVLLHFTSTPAIPDATAALAANGRSTSGVPGLTLRASSNNGSLSGKIPVSSASAIYSGVVLQKQQIARGFVRGAAMGAVQITPQQ